MPTEMKVNSMEDLKALMAVRKLMSHATVDVDKQALRGFINGEAIVVSTVRHPPAIVDAESLPFSLNLALWTLRMLSSLGSFRGNHPRTRRRRRMHLRGARSKASRPRTIRG